ncbi:hypothetical protein PHAVU_L006501 [Phaseolus vulgaris]|uniref:Uncharacterized protein n=2 Tax=Phaseolus vulgaris TaxID=3885 RepID=V7CWA2_PHAVU|nr:hypothetical protein PHAVU_001G080400g [Phaseolus vulgaris]XP_007161567.1 hypothetical protein PHAVU_001G080400g [Phaseolus vulgaris]ESW33560.1 hypothetical protein PHAVU_001G080400g [Phaseolus vulgaris]ESW33561.1 hypothetical protein PHAVU_001G080400g [Phaseolus vulgaris]
MSLLHSPLLSLPSAQCLKLKQEARLLSHGPSIGGISRTIPRTGKRNGNGIKAFFFNPVQDPIVKDALKEPVAFLGGMFAGILRLDLNEEPLKEWVTRTVEASGISEEGSNTEESTTEAAPLEIQIE